MSLLFFFVMVFASTQYNIDVAFLKPAYQSTTKGSNTANLAVNGQPDQCSITNDEQKVSWWLVDLNGYYKDIEVIFLVGTKYSIPLRNSTQELYLILSNDKDTFVSSPSIEKVDVCWSSGPIQYDENFNQRIYCESNYSYSALGFLLEGRGSFELCLMKVFGSTDLEKKTKSWNNEYVTSNMTKKAVVAKKFGELSIPTENKVYIITIALSTITFFVFIILIISYRDKFKSFRTRT